MTHEKIENLIPKILDGSHKLTDSEIADIMTDDYLRQLYDTASLLKTATAPSHTYNLDNEWLDLKTRLNRNVAARNVTRRRRWYSTAAVFGIIAICGAIALLIFPAFNDNNPSDMMAQNIIDSIRLERYTRVPDVTIEPIIDDGLTPEANNKGGNAVENTDKTSDRDLVQTNSSDSNNTAVDDILSIDQALILTDEDMMIAQIFLAADYDTAIYDSQDYMTTVNYSDGMYDDISQPSWLSEFMKYATGLTDYNLSIQRGSANMLYKLSQSKSVISDYERETALSILITLVDEGFCDNDPITKVLVLGCQTSLK